MLALAAALIAIPVAAIRRVDGRAALLVPPWTVTSVLVSPAGLSIRLRNG